MKFVKSFSLVLIILTSLSTYCFAEEITVNVTTHELIFPEGEPANGRLLLKFDLPNVVSDRRIEYAAITFGISEYLNNTSILNMQVCPIIVDWTPEGITWSEDWQQPGEKFTHQKASYFCLKDGRSNNYSVDITRIVSAWNKGEMRNYGIVIFPENRNAGYVRLSPIPGRGNNVVAEVKIKYYSE